MLKCRKKEAYTVDGKKIFNIGRNETQQVSAGIIVENNDQRTCVAFVLPIVPRLSVVIIFETIGCCLQCFFSRRSNKTGLFRRELTEELSLHFKWQKRTQRQF